MTDQETNVPAVPPSGNSIASDLMCLACAYNLRGLTCEGYCPECGLAIERTIVARQGMTKRELAALVFRITAIWMALGLITGFVPTWSFLFRDPFQTILLILGTGVSVLIVTVLWWKADRLAGRAIIEDGPLSLSGRFVPEQFMAVALGIIGVIHITYGITGAVWTAVTMVSRLSFAYSDPSVIQAVLNLTIGCVLLVGAGRIARFVIWLRTAGTVKEME